MRKSGLLTIISAGAWLFAGCGNSASGFSPEDESSLRQALSFPAADTAPHPEPRAAQDGRAAALRTADALTGAGSTDGTRWGWYTGSLAPSEEQHWQWNNAGSGVYTVGLSPSGSTAYTACQIKTLRTWDVQTPAGEREFHFIVQNSGTIACGANVFLRSQAAVGTGSTGSISPGSTTSRTWNNANPLSAAYFVNVSPAGASSTVPCELEVTRTYYSQQPSGERRFHYDIKNIGAIACSGTTLLAANTTARTSWSTGTLSPGSTITWWWNNANPHNRVYVPGVSPLGATSSTPCELELLPTSYREEMNADHSLQRRYYMGVKNVGTVSCSGTFLLNYIDPSIMNPLPVSLHPQQTGKWCWAASGQMVMSYLGVHIAQCEQANRYFARTDCCDARRPTDCVAGGIHDFDGYGFSYDTINGALSWTAIKEQIDTRRTPFTFGWQWTGGGGHRLVATGYQVISGQNWVHIYDPSLPNEGTEEDLLYDDFVSGDTYTHGWDYYNIARK